METLDERDAFFEPYLVSLLGRLLYGLFHPLLKLCSNLIDDFRSFYLGVRYGGIEAIEDVR